MFKKIILIFLGICLVASGGLTAYVSMMDWNTHRKEIADKFSEITGKKIEFSGPISVELLPQPTLSAKNVKIINPNRSSEVLATIDNLNTEVSLQSLLKGAPDIRSLSLIGAEVWVNVDDQGAVNWKNYSKTSFSDSDKNTRLQSLNIQNALVHFENPTENIKFDLSQFNADIQAETLAGPYRLDGNFIKNQDHFGLALSLGSFSGLSDVPVNFAITHPKSESFLRFDGVYMPNEQYYKGDFSGGSKQTADFANVLTDMQILDNVYNVPLQFSVGIETDDKQIKLSSFIIKYDNLMEGSGNMVIPLHAEQGKNRTISLKYQLVNLDLRPLLSILKAEYKNFKAKGSVYKPDLNINIDADISSERVVLNNSDTGALESVSLKGSWIDNTLSLDEFYAACAGNTVLTMEGSLVEEKKSPQYFVKVSVDSKDFLPFLNSLGLKLQSYTQATYRNAAASFNLSGNNNAVSVNDIKFAMDKMNIGGVAGVTFNDKGNFYELHLNSDKLNLDNYLPENEKEQNFMGNLKSDIQSLSFLKWLNINADLHSDNLTFRKNSLNNVTLKAEAKNGIVHVTELSGEDLLNTNFKLNTEVNNLGSLDIGFKDLNFDIRSSNMSEVKNSLKLPWPDWKIFKAADFEASGTYNGNLHEGTLKAKGIADEVKLEYDGLVKQDENFGFDGKLDIKTTNFGEFANNVGGSFKLTPATRGALNCNGFLSGDSPNWKFDQTSCLWGIVTYQGSGEVTVGKNTYKVAADLSADDLNLENLLEIQTSKNVPAINRQQENNFLQRPNLNADTFIFDIYRNLYLDINLTAAKVSYQGNSFKDLSVKILNSENVMQLNNLNMTADNQKINGNLLINYIQDTIVKGNLQVSDIDLANAGGSVYGFASGTMTLTGNFEMPAASVSDFVNNYTGSISFKADDVKVYGFNFAAIEEDLAKRQYSKGLFQVIRDNLQSGETKFPEFSGKINAERGSWKFENFVMQNDSAQLDVNGLVNFSDWKMNSDFTVTLSEPENIPPFTFSLSGLINKPALDINVESVARKYDAHWEELEAAEQARKAEQTRILNQNMAEAQNYVTSVSSSVNGYIPQLEEHQKNSDDEIYTAKYQQKLDRIAEINKTLDNMKGKAHLPDFTADDVSGINTYCAEVEQELQNWQDDIDNDYKTDVTARFARIGEDVENYDKKRAELVADYQKMLQEKFDSLLKIEATQFMMQNEDIKNYQTSLNEQNDAQNAQYDVISQKIDEAKALQDNIPVLEQKTAELRRLLQAYADNNKTMKGLYKSTSALLDDIISEQQKIYEEKKRKQKEQEMLENGEFPDSDENTDKAKDNPQAPVPAAETQPNEQALPVVDVKQNHIDEGAPEQTVKIQPQGNNRPTLRKITEETSGGSVSGTIKKSYEEKVQSGAQTSGGLLKEAEGAMQKPSGTIVVK